MIQLTVTTKETGMRLDAWLAVRLGVSRSRVQQWIKDGLITQKGSTVIAHNRLKAGEEFVCEADLALPKKVAKKLPKLDVVFENKDVLVVNKPAGLLVHPNTPDEKHPTLAEAAVAHDPSIAGVGENELRPGIVHRLDKEVSGVIVIAKTAEAFESLKDQFTKHETEKHYVALAYGKITKDHDFIKLKIARSKKRGRMVARPDSQEGKEAITEFRVIGRYKIATLLEVRTHTGRTHQIRTHFFAINHPLVGDKLYKKTYMRHIHPMDIGRVFLHASSLAFKLPDGTPMSFDVPLPADLENILKGLAKIRLEKVSEKKSGSVE